MAVDVPGRELARFERALAGGGASLILVCGQPGVGKTRFAEECVEVAERAGWRSVRGAASRAAAEIPLGALAHVLRSGSVAESDAGRLADLARQDLRELAGDRGRRRPPEICYPVTGPATAFRPPRH